MSNSDKGIWPGGQTAAVSLSYDDALPCHWEWVAPTLERYGLRGTFYTPIASITAQHSAERWRALAAAGHELGNHTIFHPCRGDLPGRDAWVRYDLCEYTPTRWRQEVQVANGVLGMIDGRSERTYGNTCHENTIGPAGSETCLDDDIARLFVAGRGSHMRMVDPATAEMANLGTLGGDGKTGEELIAMAAEGLAAGAWLIYCFHGVGEGTHTFHGSCEDHEALLAYLAEQAGQIWTAPVVDIARHVRERNAS